jgi:hypothetical protein
LRVVITVPSAPIQSPRSRSWKARTGSSPTTAFDTNKLDLVTAVLQRGEDELALLPDEHGPPGHRHPFLGLHTGARSAWAARISASVWLRSNRYGYGSAPAERSASILAKRLVRSASSTEEPGSAASVASSLTIERGYRGPPSAGGTIQVGTTRSGTDHEPIRISSITSNELSTGALASRAAVDRVRDIGAVEAVEPVVPAPVRAVGHHQSSDDAALGGKTSGNLTSESPIKIWNAWLLVCPFELKL